MKGYSFSNNRFLAPFFQALRNLLKKEQIEIAGYVAYMALLAFFPFIIFVLNVAALLGQSQIGEESLTQLYLLLPQEVVSTIAPVLQSFMDRQENYILTLTILGILWISSSGIEALRTGLNRAYNVQEPRPFLLRRLQSLLLIFLLLGAVFIATFLIIIGPLALNFLEKYWPWVHRFSIELQGLKYGLSFLVLLSSFTFAYWVLPCLKQSLKECMRGSLIATFLWIISAKLFSFYLTHIAHYDLIYGSIGGVIVTLLFFHLTALILLYGAELNACLRGLKDKVPG